jgi:hypothetical protein
MKNSVLFILLLGTLAMAWVMSDTGKPLVTAFTPHGIVDLELAYNTEKTNAVTSSWAKVTPVDAIAAAKRNTELDFVFIAFYSLFFFTASQKLSRKFAGAFGKAGKYFAKGALVAGFMDVLENTGMLLSLSGKGSGLVSLCTATCSLFKWAIVVFLVLYVLTGAVALLRARLLN